MNKASIALTAVAVMTAAPLAFAQEKPDRPAPTAPTAPTAPVNGTSLPPASETHPVPAEPRLNPVPGEPRLNPVPAEPRLNPVPAEPKSPQPVPPGGMPPPSDMTPSCPPSSPSASVVPPLGTTSITSGEVLAVPATPVHREAGTVTLHQTIRPNRPLLYTGGLTLIGAYVSTAALTASRRLIPSDRAMYIPIAGPWMHLSSAEDSPRDMALVIGSGVVQGVGALMTVASFVIPEKIPAATIQAGDVKMHVTPTSFGTASAGLGAVGQF